MSPRDAKVDAKADFHPRPQVEVEDVSEKAPEPFVV